jgi:beta-1,2-mannobiose phosphorylase / 1,2-beta-oligomannan phosphorylase
MTTTLNHLPVNAEPGSLRYKLERLTTLIRPDQNDPWEVEGTLNPAGVYVDGKLHLYVRIVGAGNFSRVRHFVVTEIGGKWEVERRELVLEPQESYELKQGIGGCEDPRISWNPVLNLWVMSYTGYNGVQARICLATSSDLVRWNRLGPVHFVVGRDGFNLNTRWNKDAVWFDRPVTAPDGRLAFAMLHRPMWKGGQRPAGSSHSGDSIYVSYVPLEDLRRFGPEALRRLNYHTEVATPRDNYWEDARIGAGPPPVWTPDGWLLMYHGVHYLDASRLHPVYSPGLILLDLTDVSRVIARSEHPLLSPDTEDELTGPVPNVYFPTLMVPHAVHGLLVGSGGGDWVTGLSSLRDPALALAS